MMSSRSSAFCCLTVAILLTLHVTQALRLFRAPTQIITKIDETPHNGSVVPGVSPVKYYNDPGNDLFRIESLDMYPNPCVIESYCTVLIRGEFTTSLINTTPHISFNVTSHFSDGRTGLLPGEDAFCNWVDIIQAGNDDEAYVRTHTQAPAQEYAHQPHPDIPDPLNPILPMQKHKGKLSCPPKKGGAQISATILLLGGYVPETNFTVKVKVTEGGRTIFDLWTEFEMKYKDGVVVKEGVRGYSRG